MSTNHQMIQLSPRFACLLIFPVVGCSDVGGVPTDGGTAGIGGGGTAGTGNVGGDGTGGCAQQLFIEAIGGTDGPPLEGVEICLLGTNKCGTTDSNGKAVLDDLPCNEEVAFTMVKEGYGSRVLPDVTDDEFLHGSSSVLWELYSDEQLSEIAQDLDTEYPWTGGAVGLALWVGFDPSPAGLRLVAVDCQGKEFYYDAETSTSELPKYTLDQDSTSATPRAGFIPFGQGGFVEVPEGVCEFEFEGASDCSMRSWGWYGSAPNRVRLPVMDGFMVYGSQWCAP